MPKVDTRLIGTHSKLSSKFSSVKRLSNLTLIIKSLSSEDHSLGSTAGRQTSQNHPILHAHLRILLGIFEPHTSLYVNLTILWRFYRIICACTNSVYQAVFFSPTKNGLGTRLSIVWFARQTIIVVVVSHSQTLAGGRESGQLPTLRESGYTRLVCSIILLCIYIYWIPI